MLDAAAWFWYSRAGGKKIKNVWAECVCSFGRLSCCCLARPPWRRRLAGLGLKCHGARTICFELDLKGRDLCCCLFLFSFILHAGDWYAQSCGYIYFVLTNAADNSSDLLCLSSTDAHICLWILLSLLGIHLLSVLPSLLPPLGNIYCCLSR